MIVNNKPYQNIWKPRLAVGLLPIAIASLLLFATSYLSTAQASTLRTMRLTVGSNIQQTTSLTANDTYTYYFPLVFHNYHVPTWQPIGLQTSNVRAVAVDPSTPGVLYAGTEELGVFKTVDFGKHWQPNNAGLVISPTVYRIEIDPSQPQNVYIAIPDYPRFYYSKDGGQSWQQGGGLQHIPHILSSHPLIKGRLFVGVWIFERSGGQVYKSDDGGLNWTQVISGWVVASSIIGHPLDSSRVYVSGYGVYRSQDGGNTWTRLLNGLPDGYITAMALHPTSPLTAYVSTEVGIFKTIDGGDSWSSWGSTPPYGAEKLLVSSNNPESHYVSSRCAGVYVSPDEGRYWQPINNGLGNLCVNDIALDPSSSRLYAATQDGIWALNLVNGE